jgi:hypothetical protein
MSLDGSVTMIALVSVPLLIVASFLVDLAAGHRYTQRFEHWTSSHRPRAEPVHDLWMSAGHRDGPWDGRSRRCSHMAVRAGAARSGTVRLSGGRRVCRRHLG